MALTDTHSQALSRLLNAQLSKVGSRNLEQVLCYGDCVYKKAFFSCPNQRKITKCYKKWNKATTFMCLHALLYPSYK